MSNKPMTRVEKLVKSLETKKTNLEKKRYKAFNDIVESNKQNV